MKEIEWLGSERPKDGPDCGFDGSKCRIPPRKYTDNHHITKDKHLNCTVRVRRVNNADSSRHSGLGASACDSTHLLVQTLLVRAEVGTTVVENRAERTCAT